MDVVGVLGAYYWDDNLITKERGKRCKLAEKSEGGTPTRAQDSLMDIRTGGSPWWWYWLDCKLPNAHTSRPTKKRRQ
ncbi:hypothetical protein Tco_0652460 [Tanacetum coccineum]|uniref:Uncharacterized protein n=1 Tax=Tanacetum coccineum TaxID=301880 RepID=A0ABQ4WYB5_9ASTR